MENFNLNDDSLDFACQPLIEHGLEGAADALRILINYAAKIERDNYLKAKPYQRTEQRTDYANGYKSKTLLTRLGEITCEVPQVRNSGFYPSALERGSRSEQSLNLALAEMYVQGVSTRKVTDILSKLCGGPITISSTQVSRCAAQLDEKLELWRNRPLGETPYLILDARYEKVRDNGPIKDAAVLIAVGITADGKRRVLGVSVSLSEAEVHWRAFMDSLVQRGLRGVRYLVSDQHLGLNAARKAIFTGVTWQRCQFHLQQNAQAYINRIDQRKSVGRTIRNIFNAPDEQAARNMLKEAVREWEKSAPKLAEWAEENLPQGFSVYQLPEGHRVRLRTTNGLERINKEIKRRTRVATIFPNEASCLRLISALLAERDDEWGCGKIYLNMGKTEKE